MTKIFKKFIAVFIAVMMSFTSIGFGELILNENNQKNEENLTENLNLEESPDQLRTDDINLQRTTPSVFNIRIEGNDRTIVMPNEVEITQLSLAEYGIDKNFQDAKPIHAIIKGLENAGINAKDITDGLDCGTGSYINMIDGLRQGDTGSNDGWMYYVDKLYANTGADSYEIDNGQSIVVYFQEDYTENTFTWFDKEAVNVKTGEAVSLDLNGSKYDLDSEKNITDGVKDAIILVNNEPYIESGKYLKTDKNGSFSMNFTEAGTYHISAEKKDSSGKRIISRPYCEVKVEQGEAPVIDKTELLNLIKESEALLSRAKPGTAPGEYAPEVLIDLEEAVKKSKLRADYDSLSLVELNEETLSLEKAISDFRSSVNKNQSLNEIIESIKVYYSVKDKYDFTTSMGLRKAGVDTDILADKINIYGMEDLHNNSRNILNILAIGEDPKDYKNRDYTSYLKDYDYSNQKNSQYIAKAIIAMDMSDVNYEEEQLVSLLTAQGQEDDGRIAFGSESASYYDDWDEIWTDGEFSESVEDSIWVLIALSNHKDKENVTQTIEGIKKYVKSKQKPSGLVEDSLNSALLIQGLIALGENPYDEYWSNEDKGKYNNILDGILSCRKDNQFSNSPNSGMGSDRYTSQVLAAIVDLENGKSMFRELKYEELGKPIKLSITNLDDVYTGAKFDLEVKAYDKNNKVVDDAAIELETSDENVVKIENKRIFALNEGTAKITAYIYGNKNISSEININVVIPPKVDRSEDIKREINCLKEHYEVYKSFEFLASPAAVLAGIDTNEVAYGIYEYSNTTALQNAKTIVSLVGAKLDPTKVTLNGQEVNYVNNMEASQRKEGEQKGQFIFNEGMDANSILAQSYCIIAMDLVDGNYDKESAVEALLKMLNDSDYKKEPSYKNVKTEAVAATALSKHKGMKGVENKIDDLIEFFKANQNEDGGFDLIAGSTFVNSPIATGAVIQALLANGIDPLSWQWCKSEKTMLDSMLKSKFTGSDAARSGFSQGEGLDFENTKASHYAFGALVSLSLNKSIYDLIKKEDSEKNNPVDKENVDKEAKPDINDKIDTGNKENKDTKIDEESKSTSKDKNKSSVKFDENLKPEIINKNLQVKLIDGKAEVRLGIQNVADIIKDTLTENSNQIVVEPQIDSKENPNKVSAVFEKESIERISKETDASFRFKTSMGDIRLSNKALAELAKENGNTITFSVNGNKDGSISLEIKTGLGTVSKIPSGITVSIPLAKTSVTEPQADKKQRNKNSNQEFSSSTVAVQMMPDGSEKILMKSVTEGSYLNARLDGSATVKIRENKKTYADTANHWAKDAIEFAGAREILKGTSADEFSPNEAMTKGMLVTLIHRFENEELVQGKVYDDVKSDAYYANAAAWAQVKGIAEGETDTQFMPNQEVTREQLASMIYNYAKLSGEDVSSTNEDKIKTFEDWNETSKESQEAMKYCYNNNIIGGKSDTTLDPQGKTTRAEVSAIIQRYVSKITI